MAKKLKCLYIKNFRNIKGFFVNDMKDVNIFIGKNNIGKSNYLRAVHCFFDALNSQTLYLEGVLGKEDIMSGADIEDVSLIGLLEDANEYQVVFVGCIKMGEDYYTYHYVEELYRDEHLYFIEDILSYERKFKRYGESVKEFLQAIRQIKQFTNRKEQCKNDSEYIASLTMELKMEETINAHKYIEDNLNLSSISLSLLKNQSIDKENIQESIILRLKEREDYYTARIKSCFNDLEAIERRIKEDWEEVMTSIQSRKIHFQNENILIPKVIKGINIMFQAEKKEIVALEDAQKLFALKNRKENADSWMNFKDMCKRVLDIEIDVFLDSENIPTIDVSNNSINLNGTGIREVFRIILDIEFLKPRIILIEEPEIHLHFELQQRLSEYLHIKAENAQIFITSHSTAFVEESYEKSVYLIKRRDEKENSIQLLNSKNLDEIISELGYNAQALLIKRLLIFVEGKTDKAIIDTYLQKFYPQMLSKIGCIDMKGETKYKYFANAESLEIFEKSGVETFFILDSDYKTQAEKDRKISQHPEKSSLVFWPGVCIENLFLSPIVLEKFIMAKNAEKKMDLDGIKEIMEKTYTDIKIESSRKYIREKYLTAIYPEKNLKNPVHDTEGLKEWFNEKRVKMREQLDVEVDIDKVVEEFDALWENKLDEVVPGDKFLIKFCENIGNLTYNKNEKNVGYLINDLLQEEWPTSFTQIIDEIIQRANNRVLESV
ncbi:AAA family ATPase [Bacillus cereus]|nr:AAA family ATPase [Bacillus cereus]MDA2457316.1 AAA family ATPase [Bacillus cereus]